MKNLKVIGIMPFVFIIVSFILLLILINNLTSLSKNFDSRSYPEMIHNYLTDHQEFKEYKKDKMITYREIRKGRYWFIFEDGFGVYDLFKDRIIYINKESKFNIEAQNALERAT